MISSFSYDRPRFFLFSPQCEHGYKLVKLKLKDNKLNVARRDSLWFRYDMETRLKGRDRWFSSAQNVLVFDGDSYLNQLGGTYTV